MYGVGVYFYWFIKYGCFKVIIGLKVIYEFVEKVNVFVFLDILRIVLSCMG